ncbi:hypothetical protein GCK72_014077 [Caenorhabditis remanei]|uniref:EGF-like domain-containing protein n=1 Tax=Caenorhabditis remanei TaxID=31234 RepID=A0A6A5GSH7_CAERE|nr:hypothetical protein GCK72_014077 [Caenorhabditis remanei]KAF1757621.1 hypothetical protein GCK72_014077 [Caenorhabditis remanei]
MVSKLAFSLLFCSLAAERISVSGTEKKKFDPNDCYEPGTIFEENEKNLGFCPCKYGYFGPECFDIFDCVLGELRIENCTREIQNDYDLQWRCAASNVDIVKICTCPDGFRGETCEYIMENTLSTYWKTVSQSQRYFEVIYNKSDSFLKITGSKVGQTIIEYRRLIMFVIFVLILEVAWRYTKRQEEQKEQLELDCQLAEKNKKVHLDNFKNRITYFPLNIHPRSLEEADELPVKKTIEMDSISQFSEISEISEDVVVEENTPKVYRPHLHI